MSFASTTEGTGSGSVERVFPRILNQVKSENIAKNAITQDKLAKNLSIGSGESNNSTVVSLAYASTVNTDVSLGSIFDLTLSGNVLLNNPTNSVNGKTIRWRIRQDGTERNQWLFYSRTYLTSKRENNPVTIANLAKSTNVYGV